MVKLRCVSLRALIEAGHSLWLLFTVCLWSVYSVKLRPLQMTYIERLYTASRIRPPWRPAVESTSAGCTIVTQRFSRRSISLLLLIWWLVLRCYYNSLSIVREREATVVTTSAGRVQRPKNVPLRNLWTFESSWELSASSELVAPFITWRKSLIGPSHSARSVSCRSPAGQLKIPVKLSPLK